MLPWRRWARRNRWRQSRDQGYAPWKMLNIVKIKLTRNFLDTFIINALLFSGDHRPSCSGLWPTRSSTWSSWSSSGLTCSPWRWTTTASQRCGCSPSRTSTWASFASSPPSASSRYSLCASTTSKSLGTFLISLLLFYPFSVSCHQ